MKPGNFKEHIANNFKEHIAKTLIARIKYRDDELKRLQKLVRQNSCMHCHDFANDHITLNECKYCDNRLCDDCRQGTTRWAYNEFETCLDCQDKRCNKCGEEVECHECAYVACPKNDAEDRDIYKIRLCRDCSTIRECTHGINYFCSQTCCNKHFRKYTEKCPCGKLACYHGKWTLCAAKCSTIICGTCGPYCDIHRDLKGFVGFIDDLDT